MTIHFKNGQSNSVWCTFTGDKKLWTPEKIEGLEKHYGPFFAWFKNPAEGDIWIFELDRGSKWAVRRENIVDAISTVTETTEGEEESDED